MRLVAIVCALLLACSCVTSFGLDFFDLPDQLTPKNAMKGNGYVKKMFEVTYNDKEEITMKPVAKATSAAVPTTSTAKAPAMPKDDQKHRSKLAGKKLLGKLSSKIRKTRSIFDFHAFDKDFDAEFRDVGFGYNYIVDDDRQLVASGLFGSADDTMYKNQRASEEPRRKDYLPTSWWSENDMMEDFSSTPEEHYRPKFNQNYPFATFGRKQLQPESQAMEVDGEKYTFNIDGNYMGVNEQQHIIASDMIKKYPAKRVAIPFI